MNRIKNILFDLDGTIIEPQEGIINSILFALDKLGIEERNKEALKSFIGPPLIDSFTNRYQLDTEKAKEAVGYYREYFSGKGIYQNTLYPDIVEVLQQLREHNYYLFLATSKPTIYAEEILVNYKIMEPFKGVVGSNLDHTRKDKTEIIDFVINTYKLERSETLMIGDRKYDIIGAKNNSIKSVGAVYGHGNLKELKIAGVDFVVNNCKELFSIITS
ncbi:MAG: HAD hydrolase-like protein [Cyclobacteriaceae bacterium]